jgi:hypothetical protein
MEFFFQKKILLIVFILFGSLKAEIIGSFKVITADGARVTVMGESHTYSSIEDFSRLIDDPFAYHYLLELPEGTSREKVEHLRPNSLLIRLFCDHEEKTELVDLSREKGPLPLTFSINDLFSERCEIEKIEELFSFLDVPHELDSLPETMRDDLGKIYGAKKIFDSSPEDGFFVFRDLLKSLDKEKLLFLLCHTPKAASYREQHFLKGVFACKKENILLLVGHKHLESLHRLFGEDSRVLSCEPICLFSDRC